MTLVSRSTKLIANFLLSFIFFCWLMFGIALLPSASAQDVQYSISEEQQPNTFVGNVARDVNLQAQMLPTVFASLQFNILSSSRGSGDLFSMDPGSSDLFTARRLDRESLCRYDRQCQLDLKVGAVSGAFFRNIRVRIQVNDVNDNAPKFNRSSLSLYISESVTVGASFTLIGALDDDTGVNNSVKMYSLLPNNGPFSISFSQKLDGTSDVTLLLTQPLDRERQSLYSMTLVASDGGVPRRTAEMAVEITVTDSNDNSPVFSQNSYSATISENTGPGESIATVSATDQDEGVNAQVSYRLSDHQDGSVSALFTVDADSGVISIQRLPPSGTYTVIVQAIDGGSPPREAQAGVEVKVVDTINNPPVIVVTLLSTVLSEGASLRSPVAHVSVEDPDSGNNGQVGCFSQNAYFDLRTLEAPDMMVELAATLDREDTPRYTVTLFCEDKGFPSLSVTATFTVFVEDVNDNPPVFAEPDVTQEFPEGNNVGQIVYTITATDRDVGQNAAITYKLLSLAQNQTFSVDQFSGSIVVIQDLDREKIDKYVLKVVAVDGGVPQNSATATVTILVNDVNDEIPVFSRSEYVFSIKENLPEGSLVGVLNATDSDLEDAGKISFYLSTSEVQAMTSFTLQSNGALLTKRKLDRESDGEIVFDVLAMDNALPKHSSSAKVKVILLDENDNNPIFLFPGPRNHSVTLFVPVRKDAYLCTLSVTDADEGQNSLLSYALVATNLSERFSVDTWTGDVWARKTLTDDHLGVYNLTFRAVDGGHSPRASFSSLFVAIKLGQDALPDNSTSSHVIIIIACTTVLVAAVIVLIVCLVRRRGKGKEPHSVNTTAATKTAAAAESRTSAPIFFTQGSKSIENKNFALKLNQELAQRTAKREVSPDSSPYWHPGSREAFEKNEVEEDDLQILNRVTSLRLQQAFEHISNIKSQLSAASDVGKLYEWREIHVPGRPEDLKATSLSSHSTVNGDSGLEADVEAGFLDNAAELLQSSSNLRHSSCKGGKKARRTSTSQTAWDISHDTSQLSGSFLPGVYLKPGSDILVFRPTSATSCESNPSLDDNFTTTSGSYSIAPEDLPRSRCGFALSHVQDVYV